LKIFKSKFDWDFGSSPEPNVANRSIYLCRGKVLGGSSCANVLLYHRGDSNDYKDWAKLTGDDEWSPENVLPYFKKSEDDFRGESKYHGTGGEFAVSDVRYQNPLSKTFLSACGENGYPSNDDFNNWSRSQEGYGRYQVSERDGSRCSAASGFLAPIMKRKNLNVVTKATVSRVTFNGNEASGVDVVINGESHHVGLSSGGEVLLTGGAISSPQILMLSGIGPQQHLMDHGINMVHDLQGVGKNLQDHPAAVVSYECSKGNEGISVTSVIRIPGTTINNPKVVLDWMLNKSGPLTSTGCDHGGFFKTKENLVSPDLQMRFLAARAITADGMGTFTKVFFLPPSLSLPLSLPCVGYTYPDNQAHLPSTLCYFILCEDAVGAHVYDYLTTPF
jgi:choline dehydrogenase-like flavoprotein